MILRVTDRDGAAHELDAVEGDVLMALVRDRLDNTVGVCGGALSCGTCLLQFKPEEASRLTPVSVDEQDMLDALDAKPGERLGCQLKMTTALDGLSFTVAPEA